MTEKHTNGSLARIIAHRGASGEAPENTLAAMSLAYEQGAKCVEIDVSISRDGVPYVHHDDNLDRCTSGTGLLCEHMAEELDELDASKLMPVYSPEALPRLSALIAVLDHLELGLNLEIKPRKGLEEATVEAICKLLENCWPQRLPLVFSSFSQQSLDIARRRSPDIARALLVDKLPGNWLTSVQTFECCNLHARASSLQQQDVIDVKQQGFNLYAYTVNDEALAAKLSQWGVDGVFTDYPGRLLKSLPS
ncbi:MAG: glycerophosphodiester phosphodiesterase family protein [Granulosicoccus sp.]